MTDKEIAQIITQAFAKGFRLGLDVTQKAEFQGMNIEELKSYANKQAEELLMTVLREKKKVD